MAGKPARLAGKAQHGAPLQGVTAGGGAWDCLMACGVAVAFYCLCLAPWRAGGTRRYRRALVAVALAYCFVLACAHANTHARLFLQAARGWPLAGLPLCSLWPRAQRAGCSRRSRRANLQCSLAFSLTDGRARRARCALVAFTSRLGALALPLGGARSLLLLSRLGALEPRAAPGPHISTPAFTSRLGALAATRRYRRAMMLGAVAEWAQDIMRVPRTL